MGGGDHSEAEPRMIATEEEMVAAKLPLAYRDYCAHLLIPLNKCRRQNYYLPFRCVDERHTYEKCQYDDYMRRVNEMKKQLQQERAEIRAAERAKERAAAERAASESGSLAE